MDVLKMRLNRLFRKMEMRGRFMVAPATRNDGRDTTYRVR
jgi:hypothetical protein